MSSLLASVLKCLLPVVSSIAIRGWVNQHKRLRRYSVDSVLIDYWQENKQAITPTRAVGRNDLTTAIGKIQIEMNEVN